MDFYRYIPDEAFLYFPEMKIGEGLFSNRMIFEGDIEFDDFEKQILKEYYCFLSKNQIRLSSYWRPNHILRFLQAKNFNFKETKKSMLSYEQWKNKNLPIQLTRQLAEGLKLGIFYTFGRDYCFRPIIIFDGSRLKGVNYSINLINNLVAFVLESIIHNLMIEGQIQNWIVLVDLHKIGLTQLFSVIKPVINFLSNTFRCRLYKCFIVRIPSFFSFMFKAVKEFIDQKTLQKISIYTQIVPISLFEICNSSQVQKRYGGTAQDLKIFWPPQLNSQQFFTEKKYNHLIDYQQYYERYMNHNLRDRKINKKIIDEIERKKKQQMELHRLQKIKEMDIQRKIRKASIRLYCYDKEKYQQPEEQIRQFKLFVQNINPFFSN